MPMDRREVLRDIALLGGVACLPGPSFAAEIDRIRRFGLIRMSASGITVSAYDLSKRMLVEADQLSGYDRLAPISASDVPTPISTPLAPGADASAVAPTADLISSKVDALIASGIRRTDVYIVVSSGVDAFAGPLVPMLRDKIYAQSQVMLHVLGAREQARLQFDWVVPKRERGRVFQLEVLGGNVVGGYYDRRGRTGRFFDLSVPFGTKTMAAEVKGRWLDVETVDFPKRAAQFYADSVAATLAPEQDIISGASKLPDLYLTGNIVRAAAVILYPHQIAAQHKWLALAPDDFAKIGKLVEAGTPYGIVPSDLSAAQRAVLLQLRAGIRSIFNPHQIAAGAALVDGLSRQLNFAGYKRLRYPFLASNGWGAQYLIERFTGGRQKANG
jgi:hypothetical protein